MEAADAAIREHDTPIPASDMVVDQLIGDDLGYRVTLSNAGSSLIPRSASDTIGRPADAVFSQSWETAAAIAAGTADAHRCFLLGEIDFRGDIDLVISQRGVFEWLQQALLPLMAVTSFGD